MKNEIKIKDKIVSLLNKGEAWTNVAVIFTNLSELTYNEAISIAKEIGNERFIVELDKSYGRSSN